MSAEVFADKLARWRQYTQQPWARIRYAVVEEIANDLLADAGPKHDPAYFRQLLDLELALCDREPFCRIGGLWQLVAERAVAS